MLMTQTSRSEKKSVSSFFVSTAVLSIPFWWAGALSRSQFLPGIPVSALAVLCPGTAAVILVYRANDALGVTGLLKRSFVSRRNIAWYAATVLIMPWIMVLSYVAMRLRGTSLPLPRFSAVTVLALFAVFFISALAEELGWTGYATDPLQDRVGAFWAAVIIGVAWAAWHIVPLREAHRSLIFIAEWSVGTVSARVIIVWLYNNTGSSVLAATLFHATINVTWQLFPIGGSYYDPGVSGAISALMAIGIVIIWGPRTLTRSKGAPRVAKRVPH